MSNVRVSSPQGTSRIIRSLVGPEDGEDDFEDDASLCVDSDDEIVDSDEVCSPTSDCVKHRRCQVQ